MKTPEETKKGLALCVNTNPYNYQCEECPYVEEDDGCKSMMEDALALIQQLEEQNAELVRKTEQLQRERDAAVNELVGTCQVCLWEETAKCATCHFNAEAWNVHESKWEWRGVPEGD